MSSTCQINYNLLLLAMLLANDANEFGHNMYVCMYEIICMINSEYLICIFARFIDTMQFVKME